MENREPDRTRQVDDLRIGEELPQEPADGGGIRAVGGSDVGEEDSDRSAGRVGPPFTGRAGARA